MTTPKLLTTLQACEYLQETYNITRRPSTFERWRTNGGGPRFVRNGKRPFYTPESLDEWAQNMMGTTYAHTGEESAA